MMLFIGCALDKTDCVTDSSRFFFCCWFATKNQQKTREKKRSFFDPFLTTKKNIVGQKQFADFWDTP